MRVAKIGLLLLSIAFVWSCPGFCQDPPCSEVRLDTKTGSMAQVPVTDQRPDNTCYAHVAAALAGAYKNSLYSSQNDSAVFSPEAVAIANKIFNHKTSVNLGRACEALEAIKNLKGCDSRKFYNLPLSAAERNVLGFDLKSEWQPGQIELVGDSGFEQTIQILSSKEGMSPLLKKQCLGLAGGSLSPLGIFKRHCKGAEILFDYPGCQYFGRALDNGSITASAKSFRSILDQWFNQKDPQPMGISYCGQILLKGKQFKWNQKNRYDFGCGSHAGLIIGRRFNDQLKKCQYLVRNSWGTKFEDYSRDWEAHSGNIWIDADALSHSVIEMFAIKPRH